MARKPVWGRGDNQVVGEDHSLAWACTQGAGSKLVLGGVEGGRLVCVRVRRAGEEPPLCGCECQALLKGTASKLKMFIIDMMDATQSFPLL